MRRVVLFAAAILLVATPGAGAEPVSLRNFSV